MKIAFTILICLVAMIAKAQSSFSLPGDGIWYKVATISGHHGYIDYIYWHDTGYNPSITKGEIEFINGVNNTIQHHQTMGYAAWNQPQFSLLNFGSYSELWVKATNGISTGTFKINDVINATLHNGSVSDSNLSDNGGTLTVYDKFADNSHIFMGHVGIGTVNPGNYTLAVEGKIGAREVNVTTTTPWPDYVFEKEYTLPSLDSVKTYIDQHKHLPEVPSAKEIEANGVNLGEMNMLLLKKIEEMTLYLIEQDEQMTMLKEEHSADVETLKEKTETMMGYILKQEKRISELEKMNNK